MGNNLSDLKMEGNFCRLFKTIGNGEVAELAEGASLLRKCAGNRTVGSNPTLSAFPK